MMADFIPYVPKKEYDARKQVESFIAYCRDELTIFADKDPSFDWSALRWDVTKTVPLSGRNAKNMIKFTKLPKEDEQSSNEPLSQPLGDFARAFIRHRRGQDEIKDFSTDLVVLRCLEVALLEHSPDEEARIERVNHSVLNRALEIIRSRYTKSVAITYAAQLAYTYSQLQKFKMVANPVNWKQPLGSNKNQYAGKTDAEKIAARDKKLPTEQAFEAVLKIFGKGVEALSPKDQVVTSLLLIASAAPSRSAEQVVVRDDCEISRETSNEEEEYCLRWFPVKGGDPQFKPIPRGFEGRVKEALKRLRHLSKDARTMAKWYEKHPDKVYLPQEFEHLRKKGWLSTKDLTTLLGMSKGGLTTLFKRDKCPLYRESDPNHKKAGIAYRYRFAEFEQYVLSLLPTTFPWADEANKLKYSGCLNIYPQYSLDNRPGQGSQVMFTFFDTTALAKQIAKPKSAEKKYKGATLFTRHGYYDDNGEPLSARTHSFRHLLTTMAQQAGMTTIERTAWRGSKSLEQTDAYSHKTSDEMRKTIDITPMQEASGQGKDLPAIRPVSPEELEEYKQAGDLQLQTNDLGVCIHPTAVEPCPRYLDCISCTEQLIQAGNKEAIRLLECQVDEAKMCLRNAENEKDAGFDEADPWIKCQRKTIDNGKAWLSILTDERIEAGTWIKRDEIEQYEPFLESAKRRAELTGDDQILRILDQQKALTGT